MAYFDEALPTHAVKMGFDLSVIEGRWRYWRHGFPLGNLQGTADVNGIVHVHSRMSMC